MSEPGEAGSGRRRVLEPTDRFSEVVFGVIMAMTVTGAVRVTSAGEQDVQQLLYAALGCNLAWGVVDAVMYVLTGLAERGWAVRVAREIGAANDAAAGRAIVKDNLPDGVAHLLPASALEGLRAAITEDVRDLPRPRVTRDDLSGALAVLALVVLATLPVTLPFVLISDVALALRASNGVGLAVLFLSGSALGHYAGFGSWRSGVVMLAIGVVLVGLTIALGG